jgi:hypothetical protein
VRGSVGRDGGSAWQEGRCCPLTKRAGNHGRPFCAWILHQYGAYTREMWEEIKRAWSRSEAQGQDKAVETQTALPKRQFDRANRRDRGRLRSGAGRRGLRGTLVDGSFALLPRQVVIGAPMTFQADLPPGLVGVFAFGVRLHRGHAADPAGAGARLHGSRRIRVDPRRLSPAAGLRLRDPENAAFRGMDLTAQMAVVPDLGVLVPPLSLPPGRRFVLQ